MANKKKRVDIVSVHIESQVDGVEAPSFTDLLSLLFGKVELYESKIYEFRSLATTLENCEIGLVETIQDKDIPPIKKPRLLVKYKSIRQKKDWLLVMSFFIILVCKC